MGEDDPAALIALAERLADAAAGETLARFRQGGMVADNKAGSDGFDPVTEADRRAEAAMRRILSAERPEDSILGEEEAGHAGRSGRTWILDPVDGTRAFLAGIPSWGTLIALDQGAGPVLGVIDQPWMGERLVGGFGTARVTARGVARPLAVRPCAHLSDAILLSTFPEIGTEDERAGFAEVSRRVRLTRYGLDCYGYALLAMGHVDLVIEAGLAPYDIAAPIAVIEAAGGIVTDWTGGPAHGGGRVLAAGDRRSHAQALALLSRVA